MSQTWWDIMGQIRSLKKCHPRHPRELRLVVWSLKLEIQIRSNCIKIRQTMTLFISNSDTLWSRNHLMSNYHPVLLRWQISNMIFCIPVNGKTVKSDKLTNKPEKIRKSVVVSCSLKNKSWYMQWRDGKYRKEKDGCERWEIRRKGKNKCAIPGEPQEVHGMYEIPHWLIVPHLHLLQ